ncbi:hypothetical protein D3Z36_14525 [Lachnospiraceae bacterium]|nr:hypothetical protein [Lachnospiraceae bacterium]
MSEEIKERLSKTEYDRIGDMLLELFGDCPYIPKDAKIKYNSKDVGKCVYIMTGAGGIKNRDIIGGFTAELPIQVAYQSFPQGNGQMINAQDVVDNITEWLEDIENLPKLTGNRAITKITAGGSFPDVEEVEGDKATVFAANVVMEYRKKGEY